MKGFFTKFRDKAGQFRFNLKAANHEIILQSEGYSSSQACDTGIASVRTNSPYDSRYARLTSKIGEPYFVLKASQGEPIGVSEMYSSTQKRDEGIEAVKRIAPTAEVKDMTKVAV